MSEPELRQLLTEYLEDRIDLKAVEERIFDLDLPQEDAITGQIAGLLAEASHAHWDKEQVATALRPFVVGFAQNHAGTPSQLPTPESNAAFDETIASVAA
jgi:hypothetical protein